MNGGTGYDGQSLLSWIDTIEMGGTLLLEATGVTLAANSSGSLPDSSSASTPRHAASQDSGRPRKEAPALSRCSP